jgi:hypothetical protein
LVPNATAQIREPPAKVSLSLSPPPRDCDTSHCYTNKIIERSGAGDPAAGRKKPGVLAGFFCRIKGKTGEKIRII